MNAQPDARFSLKRANFEKAFQALTDALAAPIERPRDLSGIVKDFEIVYELAWTTLKTFLEGQGHSTGSARETFAKAYQLHFLNDEAVWLEMISDRNLTVHTYNSDFAHDLSERIHTLYFPAFQSLRILFQKPESPDVR